MLCKCYLRKRKWLEVSSISALRKLSIVVMNRCAKKCDAEVLSKVKVLPPVLMIRMQRLQFDRGSGNQMKLRNGVQIPLTLDFSDFSNLVRIQWS